MFSFIVCHTLPGRYSKVTFTTSEFNLRFSVIGRVERAFSKAPMVAHFFKSVILAVRTLALDSVHRVVMGSFNMVNERLNRCCPGVPGEGQTATAYWTLRKSNNGEYKI